ncbi:MAG: hypothetical protein FWF57_09910 [Defluviitaleaceae bacterium]|nr:hypothetical protein [Defluviitaleaceae bacterium]
MKFKEQEDFKNAILKYEEDKNVDISSKSLGFSTDASFIFRDRISIGKNIFANVIGIIIGIFTGRFITTIDTSTTDVAYIVTDESLILLNTKKEKNEFKKKETVITSHTFLPFNLIKSYTILKVSFVKGLKIVGKIPDVSGTYKVHLYYHKDEHKDLIIKLQNIFKQKKLKKGKNIAGFMFMLLMVVGFVLITITVLPRVLNTYREVNMVEFVRNINSPTRANGGDYQDRTITIPALIVSEVFELNVSGIGNSNFLLARLPDAPTNQRNFLIQIPEGSYEPNIGYVYNVRAIGQGAITQTRPEGNLAFTNFFAWLGDVRLRYLQSPSENLRGDSYYHIKLLDAEQIK